MDNNSLVLLFILFFIKHCIFDFLLQPSWMYLNKGKLGHIGGVAHSLAHCISSLAILLFFDVSPVILYILFGVEFIIHYFTDLLKVQINNKFKWGCNTHNEFWYATGIDQLIHYLTYALMVLIVINS